MFFPFILYIFLILILVFLILACTKMCFLSFNFDGHFVTFMCQLQYD